jgi:hypothetical protein
MEEILQACPYQSVYRNTIRKNSLIKINKIKMLRMRRPPAALLFWYGSEQKNFQHPLIIYRGLES